MKPMEGGRTDDISRQHVLGAQGERDHHSVNFQFDANLRWSGRWSRMRNSRWGFQAKADTKEGTGSGQLTNMVMISERPEPTHD